MSKFDKLIDESYDKFLQKESFENISRLADDLRAKLIDWGILDQEAAKSKGTTVNIDGIMVKVVGEVDSYGQEDQETEEPSQAELAKDLGDPDKVADVTNAANKTLDDVKKALGKVV